MRPLLLLLLIPLVTAFHPTPSAAAGAGAAAPAAGDRGCRRCDYRGVQVCPQHDAWLLEAEARVVRCSWAAACAQCAGALLIDCKHCDGGPESASVDARRSAVAEWLRPNALEAFLERPVMRVETKRYNLVVEAGVLREKRKKIEPHVLAHRLADDVEHVHARLSEHYAIESHELHTKYRMWLWSSPDTHQDVTARFLNNRTTADFKMLGLNPALSSWTEPPFLDEVPELRSLFAHNATHLLLSDFSRPLWVGDLGGGWLDAGAGHWYEYERLGRTLSYCIEEATAPGGYAKGQWRAAVRKRLERDATPHLPRLVPLSTGAMRQEDQALCWSFYDYLLDAHPEALRPLLLDLKQRKEARVSLPEHLGMSLFEADSAWRQWVSATYPIKGDKPRASAAGKRRR